MRWPLDNIRITNGFDPVNHKGNDLAANKGTPIYAPESGKVTGINTGWTGKAPNDYFGGNYVVIQGNSGYRYYMGHMDSVNTYLGAQVSEGQLIGHVGETGNATGPHVHFEITAGGKAYDPSLIIKQNEGVDMERIKELEAMANYRQALLDSIGATVSVKAPVDGNSVPQVINNIKVQQARIDELTGLVGSLEQQLKLKPGTLNKDNVLAYVKEHLS